MYGLLPLICFWLLIFVIGNINKKRIAAGQNKQGPNAQRVNAPAPPAPIPAAPAPVKPAAPVHEAKPLEAHMHVPVMGQEGVGTEGVDCCHEYMLESPREEPEPAFSPVTEQTDDEKARMLLQGVIFSEVLGRRRPLRYGGRRA